MSATILYKYLDIKVGLAMLEHHNLQFTNVTKFNDPFDCHPALFDYSHVPERTHNWPPSDFLSLKWRKTHLKVVMVDCKSQSIIPLKHWSQKK